MLDYHRKLLADETRMRAYRDAIHSLVRSNDVVLDLGAGTGVLSFFACEAGAARVYAVEEQHMADVIRLLSKENGFADRIVVLHEHSSKIELPERASVLVTETMGAFGFEEQIASSILDARQRLLRDDARIVPNRLALFVTPVELPRHYEERVAWSGALPYFAQLRTFTANTITTADVSREAQLAEAVRIIDVDLTAHGETTFTGSASFAVTREATLHGFGGWFEASLAPDITISNAAPGETHWRQVFLPLEEPLAVAHGTRIELELQTRDGKAWRWRGRAGERAFDQTTLLAMPPCDQRAP